MTTRFAGVRVPASVLRWWATKTTNERRTLVAVAMLAVAASAWWLVWQPLERDVRAMRAASARNAATLAAAMTMANEVAGLARASDAAPPANARNDLERVLAERGLRSAVTQLEWQGERAHVVIADIRFERLVGALEALQRDARLRVVEATLTARVEPDTVRAEIVLSR